MKFLFLEPFYGGSHRDFADGWIAHSRHQIDLASIPARFWKWRMRGAALHFASNRSSLDEYAGLIVTDLMSLADFKALMGPACPPALVYFHENQLTYPLAPGERMDVQFGFTDITTALAAHRVLFNSRTHFNQFFSTLPGFLNKMPDFRPKWIPGAIRAKAGILQPGCRFPAAAGPLSPGPGSLDSPPLIIWNHRWEFDKDPDAFFDALNRVLAGGVEFRLALLGENFQMVPKAFIAARERLGDRIVRYGWTESREEYLQWLAQGAIVVSTANQENFGISMVEAIRFGCLPLAPDRLAYPEVIPEAFHEDCLYNDRSELVEKLARALTDFPRFFDVRRELSEAMEPHAWEHRVDAFDDELERLAGKN